MMAAYTITFLLVRTQHGEHGVRSLHIAIQMGNDDTLAHLAHGIEQATVSLDMQPIRGTIVGPKIW